MGTTLAAGELIFPALDEFLHFMLVLSGDENEIGFLHLLSKDFSVVLFDRFGKFV